MIYPNSWGAAMAAWLEEEPYPPVEPSDAQEQPEQPKKPVRTSPLRSFAEIKITVSGVCVIIGTIALLVGAAVCLLSRGRKK